METTNMNNEDQMTTGDQSQGNKDEEQQQNGPGDTTEEQKVVNGQDDGIVNSQEGETIHVQHDGNEDTARDSWGKDRDGIQKEQPEFVEPANDDKLPDPIDPQPGKSSEETTTM